jgi:serine protease Do
MLVQRNYHYIPCINNTEFTMSASAKSNKSVLALVAVGLLGATLLTAPSIMPFPAQAQGTIQAIDPTKGFSTLVEHVMPSVVSVEVEFLATANDNKGPDLENMPPEFRDFLEKFPQFRDRFPNQGHGPGMAVGSGFVISADGYVVTNNHVVKDADSVKVRFQKGGEFKAKVIGTDPKTDLALLKIESDKSFDYVPLTSNEAKVGDWVMAVGNPFGLGGTVTAGIVSARGRDIGSGPYDDYLQIDASINKGNSGGPAFNLEGEVIGVNTAIFSPSGGSVGIGFAIPASVVKTVVEDLKSEGKVTRGWLGVQIQPVTDDLAEGLGLSEAKGAIISDLTENSPALKAGLKQGDTILKANGEDITDVKDLSKTVASVKPGTKIPVEILRNGKGETIMVEIGTMPGEMPKMASTAEDPNKPLSLTDLGLDVEQADDGAGLKITKIDPNSEAARIGMKVGDIILEIAGKPVASPAEVAQSIEKTKGKRVLMLVRQGDNQRFITLPRDQG